MFCVFCGVGNYGASSESMPKLFTMPIEIFRHKLLPENYIILSNDVADALEEAMKKQ